MSVFKHEYVTDNLIRIIDIFQTAAYLVLGEKRACLIDTCNGIGNLKEYIETLTSLPYDVVLTHGHFDHAGAASLFDEVYMNLKDKEVYKEYYNHPLKQAYLAMLPKNEEIQFNVQRTAPFLPLLDQQIFDLGKIHVKMIEVSGHTQGMMMALIPEEKMMLFGDACGESVLIFDDYSSTISEYRESLYHIKNEYESLYNHVLRNHGSFESDKSILDTVIQCCNDILDKKDAHFPVKALGAVDCFAAHEVNEKSQRIDGGHGNIVYRSDKAI